MKKTSFVFLLFVLYCFSQPISKTEAFKIASHFSRQRLKAKAILDSSHVQTFKLDGIPTLYLFHLEPEGFIVIPAWMVRTPILAYGYHTTLNEKPHPAFLTWIDQYARQIKFAHSHNIIVNSETKRLYEAYIASQIPSVKAQVGPLLNTTWNQGTYYNMYCPYDPHGPDKRCVTGCVATAIGQLFAYFRWPTQGVGVYTSEDTTYGILSVDFSQQHYNYNEMPISATSENREMAKLLYHIGVSVDMHYGPYGSGMNNHKAAYVMKEFFQYNPQTQYVFRDTFQGNWTNLILQHLNQHLPMYYAGWSDTMYISGHAFVVDGYQDSTFFHFNWGWGGAYDGYFYLDNLTPGGQNFNLKQELVIHMIPTGSYPPYCQGIDTLRSLDGIIDDGSGPLYPYKTNSHCGWLIAPNDSVLGYDVSFLAFNTIANDGIVKIYAGADESSPQVGTYSGLLAPFQLHVPGTSKLFITFSSNVDSAQGFLLSYHAITPTFCSGITTLTQPSDTFSDGSGPYPYHGNSLCRWKIQTLQPTWIEFLEFELDSTDYLRVYDYMTNTSIDLTGFDIPAPIFSASGDLMITFKTSPTYSANGFKAYYRPSFVNLQDNTINFKIYPNPFQDQIYIVGLTSKTNCVVRSMDGKIIYQLSVEPDRNVVSLNTLAPGLYVLSLQNENTTYTMPILKK